MRPLRVAILLESSLEISRRIFKGIVGYIDRHDPWMIDFIPGSMQEQRLPDGWEGDGIIARVADEKEAHRLASHPAPKVLFDLIDVFRHKEHPLSAWPHVSADNYGCGRMAGDYFLSRGFSSFAYVDATLSAAPAMGELWREDLNWRAFRRKGFVDRLAENGFSCAIYKLPTKRSESANAYLERSRLVKFLLSLKKPAAIYCPNDARGRMVADACLVAGISVPYQISILGTNNDTTICGISQPSLSSIPLDAETAGQKAAIALSALMHGKHRVDNYTYRPQPVVTRTSSLNLQTDDPVVISTLERIRKARGFNLRVNELARVSSISERQLSARFQSAIGRSIGDVLQETCLLNVQKLVRTTDLPFFRIAALAGHQSVPHLTSAYKARFGCTMSQERNAIRPSGSFI